MSAKLDRSVVAVMGATGTGKSTFIKLLTNDDSVHIGHTPDSETSTIQTAQYTDGETGRTVVLVDTPGFDDSREGITDTDVLEKIARFLEPEYSEACSLNGIIYMHRISDPRAGGLARKNLKMLQALCGDNNLDHVRIVTTNWRRVSNEEGTQRQEALARGAYKNLIDRGAEIRRHTDTTESAQHIVSELVSLSPVTMQIQDELRRGVKLGDTSAGAILTAELRELKEKHEEDLLKLRVEMDEAAAANDFALRAELEDDRDELEQKMERAEEDLSNLDRQLRIIRTKSVVQQRNTFQPPLRGTTGPSGIVMWLWMLFPEFLRTMLRSASAFFGLR